jgi:pimeloyl-ACP methyl ester carboxylesterase
MKVSHVLFGLFVTIASPWPVVAQAGVETHHPEETTIVLVHGLFADGSSWERVIPLLQARGMRVVSVQNPLTSLSDDVAATKRVIDAQPGRVVLVGHSWGGVVITQAGNDPKVVALVYVSAFAPAAGESISSIVAPFPAPAWQSQLVSEGGFLSLSPYGVANYFAPDLSPSEIGVLTATQGPFLIACLTDAITQDATDTRASWWVIPTEDQIINPELQVAMAARIRAKVQKIRSSHVVMLSHPREVAEVILNAAASAQ